MKKILFSIFAAVMAIGFVGCEYDDSELVGRVDNLEQRVLTLEQLCQQMNTNITAMQAIVNALQTQDAITSVTPITEGSKTIGYAITFAKGEPITIYHGQDGKNGADGEDGKDGYTPVIGVDKDEDGVYYWTLDGEWLTDADGNKIPTSGKDGADGEDGEGGKAGMPELRIQGGYWYVSYDGGENWERLGRATGYDGTDGDAFFDDVKIVGDYVVFSFTDGTPDIKIPLYKALSVEIKPEKDYIVVAGEDLRLKYVVSDCPNPTIVVISDLKTTFDDAFITVEAPASKVGLDAVESVTIMVSNGSTTVMDSVEITIKDFDPTTNNVQVQTVEQLLRWAYLVNEKDENELDFELLNDIELPSFTIEPDHDKETYVITKTPITIDNNGVPSGSNWVPICGNLSTLADAYSGHIEGNDNAIKGLKVVAGYDQVGFIGAMYDNASIKNLILEDAVVKGNTETGAVVGRSHNGTIVENVSVKASTITGKDNVGGIVGLNYRRIKSGIDEEISIVRNCTTDKDTQVVGSSSGVGGICGNNYGAVVINCINNADVTGSSTVGGVCGQSREYNTGVNGYLIACGSTADATITATGTDGAVGGVVGSAVIDRKNHGNDVESYVVACYSNSSISGGKYRGTILGTNNNCIIRASWGEKNGATEIAGYTATQPTLYSTYSFDSVSNVTQTEVDNMNQAITDYNNRPDIEGYTCDYVWSWTSGGWPTLTPSSNP